MAFPCWGWILIILAVFLIIFIFAITILFIINYYKNKFVYNYRLNTLDFCNSLPPITYTNNIVKNPYVNQANNPMDLIYQNNGGYYYPLAQALIDISTAVCRANCYNILPLNLPPGFSYAKRLVSRNPVSDNIRMVGYIFNNSNNDIVVAFSGTFFIDQWISDINFPQVAPTDLTDYKSGTLVHRGFYDIYMTVRDEIWAYYNNISETKTLYITGISLGGALSTLCAYDFRLNDNIIHYSFASPRVGNPDFAKYYDASYSYPIKNMRYSFRVNNTEDIITDAPLPIMGRYYYQHVNNNIPFTINLGTVGDNHVMAYVKYLPRGKYLYLS